MRERPSDPRRHGHDLPGIGVTLLSVAIPAAVWGLFSRSAWVAIATFVICGLPPVWAAPRRVGFLQWLGFGLLAGGTITAGALLTGHARVP